MTYVYDRKFSGNILVVGRTGCGKTAFVQKLATNIFWQIKCSRMGVFYKTRQGNRG